MTAVPDRNTFENGNAGQAPWDSEGVDLGFGGR
jgi:hypothetical protein